MTLRQKIERQIIELYGEYTTFDHESDREKFIIMMDHIMYEISKEVYGKPLYGMK